MTVVKAINGYDSYSITDKGKVYSNGKELKQYINGGHLYVYLYKCGKRKKFYVHRLVAETFIPNPNKYPIVNHKDEDSKNNNVSNLEWCTHKYNTNYGTCVKRRAANHKRRIQQLDMNGNIVFVFDGIIDAANLLGIDASSISKAALGKRGSAGGFCWKYECG